MVKIEDLSKRFDSKIGTLLALYKISLSVEEGEFISIIGPSGCGKSTLLRIIAGLITPSAGSVFLAGAKVCEPSNEIAMVFQSPALLPWRTVLGNVELPTEVKKLPKAEYRQRALNLIGLVGLTGFENHYPYQLSGGMQQRVSLCRALICDPPIVLMDEPFGALDALTREQMTVELQRIWLEKRKTVIFVTHSIPEAVFLSDRIIVMTPTPGTIKSNVAVELPRPRTLEMFRMPSFWGLSEELRRDLGSDQAAS